MILDSLLPLICKHQNSKSILLLLVLLVPFLANAQQGFWEGPYDLPVIPVASANLPDGKILVWSAYDLTNSNRRGEGKTWTAVWDPATPDVIPVGELIETTGHDMFCPGTAYLPGGRLVISGGSNDARTTIYDNGTWRRGGDMQLPRGYHSSTVTADGEIFTLGGSWHNRVSRGDVGNWFVWIGRYRVFKWFFDRFLPKKFQRKDGEVWDPTTEQWTIKSGIKCEGSIVTQDVLGTYRNDNHMWLFAAPNGKIFHAGPSVMTHYISLDGEGSIQEVGSRGAEDAMCGAAIMFDIGKILTLGGSKDYEFAPGSKKAHVITLDDNGDAVTIEPTHDMLYPRAMVNVVALPDGKVIVVGGMLTALTFSSEGAVFTAEMFDPDTMQFTPLADMTVERNYHASALLMKDGRVFAGGGGHCAKNCDTINKFDCEVYTPPYLVDPLTNELIANRPEITDSPASASPGDSIMVETDVPVASFSLIRLSAATHSTNNDSRRIPLVPVSTSNATSYTLTLPKVTIALPGSYYLFAMDGRGVPSVAETISIDLS